MHSGHQFRNTAWPEASCSFPDGVSGTTLALDLIANAQPYLVTSSPPCTTLSPLRRLSDYKTSMRKVELEKKVGLERLRKAMACCKLQLEQGGFFLHERPKGSSSWSEPEVRELVEREDTYVVQSPMCKFGMKMENDEAKCATCARRRCG